jgi:hypothetical protein
MKANEIPERIYISLIPSISGGYVYTTVNKDFPNAVEYTRTDTFIEKALSWLKNHYRDYMHNPTGKRLEAFFGIDLCNDFENYMKGE